MYKYLTFQLLQFTLENFKVIKVFVFLRPFSFKSLNKLDTLSFQINCYFMQMRVINKNKFYCLKDSFGKILENFGSKLFCINFLFSRASILYHFAIFLSFLFWSIDKSVLYENFFGKFLILRNLVVADIFVNPPQGKSQN